MLADALGRPLHCSAESEATGRGAALLAMEALGVAPERADAADAIHEVVMPDAAAELLFQVIAGRAERSAVIVTTNLPFSEWTTKFPNARLCKAMLDRLTDQANIIETGEESYRFRRTLAKKGGKA